MKKITVVEDDPDLRGLIEVVLRSHSYDVQVFPNAETFLENYNGTADLLIFDLNLGGMSGVELCRFLKQQSTHRPTPVIIISAHPELETLSKEVGADAFLKKSFTRASLIALISTLL